MKSIYYLIIGLILVESIPVTAIASLFTTTEKTTITAKVTKIDYLDNYMIIYFSNGESYNIDYSTDLITDFDDSKNVTVKLVKTNLFWTMNTNDCWKINGIIKY